MTWAIHDLLGLNAGKLGETAVGCLVTPNALAGREHGVAAITFFVVAIILVAVHNNFVAHFPAGDT